VRAVPARVRLPRTAERQTPARGPDRSSRSRGTEPEPACEVAAWQADDFWQYAISAAAAYIRAAVSLAGISAQLDLNRPTSSCARSPGRFSWGSPGLTTP
jgi:hypothetical protein